MDVPEAIQTAIAFETRVRDVYADAAARCDDEVGRRVFQVLADEEQGHLDYLQHRLQEWRQNGRITVAELETRLPSPAAIAEGIRRVKKPLSGEDRSTELELLRQALEVETETARFYREMVDLLPDDGRRMFARFVEIEEGHRAVVEAEIDAVSGSGFWFDLREFDLEAE